MGTRVAAAAGVGRLAPPAAATWIVAKGGADIYWRAEAPASAVGGKVIAVLEKDLVGAFATPNMRSEFPWSIHMRTPEGEVLSATSKTGWRRLAKAKQRYTAMWSEFPAVEGTAVWTRPDIPRATLAYAMRDQGIRTVAEADDNYFAPVKQNLFLRHNGGGPEYRDRHARAMWSMDACVFSTAALRDIYRKEFRERFGKKNMPGMYVCRNSVPRSDWPTRDEGDGRLRVGYMGSPSHVWDVNLAYAAFHAAREHGYETVMIGYNPADPDAGLSPELKANEHEWRSAKSFAYQEKWSKVIGRHIPWVDPGEYHRAPLPLDIGIASILSDSFTLGKSDAKAVEYTISGAACVLQNNPVYNTAGWKHEVNCLMAATQEDFAYAVLRLAQDSKLRYELVSAAQEMVWNERNEETLREEWEEAING